MLSESMRRATISDFTLHSLGVILFRRSKADVFNRFASDVLPKIDIVSLSVESYTTLPAIKDEHNLDFDDSYQCKVAEENGLTIVTMDKDFKRVENRVKVVFLK